MCFCACKSLVHMQCGRSQPLVKMDICVWMFMIHCVSFVPSERLSVFSKFCWCCLWLCVYVCVCVCFWANPGHAQREATSWWSRCLSVADGPDTTHRQFTHTPNWQVAQAPEDREFPASQREPPASPQQQTESGWRRETERGSEDRRREKIQWREKCKSSEQKEKEIEVVESINNWLTSLLKPSINVYPQNAHTHSRTQWIISRQSFISWTKGFSSALYRLRDAVITRAKQPLNNAVKLLWQQGISCLLSTSRMYGSFSQHHYLNHIHF